MEKGQIRIAPEDGATGFADSLVVRFDKGEGINYISGLGPGASRRMDVPLTKMGSRGARSGLGVEDLARSHRPDSLSVVPAALSCPVNSRYELCAPGLGQASCNPDAVPAQLLSAPVREGCVCLEGFVESGGACVAAPSCGCIYKGRPLAPGQEVWADDHLPAALHLRCHHRPGALQRHAGLPNGRARLVQNGLRVVTPTARNLRGVRGPALRELGWPTLDFMGTCTHLLAGSCGQASGLQTFPGGGKRASAARP